MKQKQNDTTQTIDRPAKILQQINASGDPETKKPPTNIHNTIAISDAKVITVAIFLIFSFIVSNIVAWAASMQAQAG